LSVDARILAATNVDLESHARKQLFRRDLLYRLKEFTVTVPPLRERREDIPHLATRFLDLANVELGKNVGGFTPAVSEMLVNYDWPGNVRELLHAVRRAVLLAHDMVTEREIEVRCAPLASSNGEARGTSWNGLPMREIVRRHLISVEREVLSDALRITAGNKAAAARLLKIDYKTIHQKVKEYQISPKRGGR
jgi:DNA-binding NtrC family response regulator